MTEPTGESSAGETCCYTTQAGVERYISQLAESLRGSERQVLKGSPTRVQGIKDPTLILIVK